jgi:hypothetical protein
MNNEREDQENLNKKELSPVDGGHKRVIVNLYDNHDIPKEVELTKMQDIIIGCDEKGYRGKQIKSVTLPDVLFSPSGKGVHQRTSKAALGLLLHSGTAFHHGNDFITIQLVGEDGKEQTMKILCKIPGPMESPAKELWQLGSRLMELSDPLVRLLSRSESALRADHAAQSLVLSQHSHLLLWVAGGLDRFSPRVPISNRAKLEDTTSRKTLQNIKQELDFLKRKKVELATTPNAQFFLQKTLSCLDEARELCHAAVNDKTILKAGLVDAKFQSVAADVQVLKDKYPAACASADNWYLMAFVDHLLIYAKTVFDDPEGEVDDSQPLSNWIAMQDVVPIKDRIYFCGDVDVENVWNSISANISEALSHGETPSQPIGAMLYSLALVELAAEITSKL